MELFQWDVGKSEFNLKKHGVSFQEALALFFDSQAIQYFDKHHSQTEDRFWILGLSSLDRVLLVVYTFRRTSYGKENRYYYRIISARPAKKGEIELYFQRSKE